MRMGLSLLWSTMTVFSHPSFDICRWDTRWDETSLGLQELCSSRRNRAPALPLLAGRHSTDKAGAPAAWGKLWQCRPPYAIKQQPTSNFKAVAATQPCHRRVWMGLFSYLLCKCLGGQQCYPLLATNSRILSGAESWFLTTENVYKV